VRITEGEQYVVPVGKVLVITCVIAGNPRGYDLV